jgi:hypothetical protein
MGAGAPMTRYFKRDRSERFYHNKARVWVEITKEEYDKMSKETVEVAVEILEEREASWLVSDGDREVWIPKSQIEDSKDELTEGVHTTIEIPEWLAQDRGLI